MNISVLGCGRWGSFLAWYANQIGHKVINFGLSSSESYQVLKNTGKNEYVTLSKEIDLSCDLQMTVNHADIIIISISSQGLRGFCKEIVKHNIKNKKFILCMKGIELESGKRLSQVAIESGIDKDNVAVWVGPGHIQDFTKNIPNCMVIDSYNRELTKFLSDTFKSSLIRFYYGNDIIGTEVGAATKNIMGIVAGALDGFHYASLKGPLMARGAREVARLIKALGGNEFSAYGLCHLGDYETTLFSQFSHNRMWGEKFVNGETFEKLAEGVTTAQAIDKLAKSLKVDMPITDAVNKMIHHNVPPLEMLEMLFERGTKEEFYE